MWDSMKVIEWFEKKYPKYMLLISSDYMYNKTKIKVVRVKDSLTIVTMEFDIHEEVTTDWICLRLKDLICEFENLTITQRIVNPDNSLNKLCPNCGAHHNGVKCEYCDTVFTYNLCTPDIRQEYLNECYKLACQEQESKMRMAFFDYPLPKHSP